MDDKTVIAGLDKEIGRELLDQRRGRLVTLRLAFYRKDRGVGYIDVDAALERRRAHTLIRC